MNDEDAAWSVAKSWQREADLANKQCQRLDLMVESYRAKLAEALHLIDPAHSEDCADQDDRFSPDETCECGAIIAQHFIAETHKTLEKK